MIVVSLKLLIKLNREGYEAKMERAAKYLIALRPFAVLKFFVASLS